MTRTRRSIVNVLADLLDAAAMAEELTQRGRAAYDTDRMLRLAAEAILGRIGDAAAKLHEHFGDELPTEVPWRDVIGKRILVDHSYHRLDYDVVWATLTTDVPELRRTITEWAVSRHLWSTAGEADTTPAPSTDE